MKLGFDYYELELAKFFKDRFNWILIKGNPMLGEDAINGYSLKELDSYKTYVYTELSLSNLAKLKRQLLLNEYIDYWSLVVNVS